MIAAISARSSAGKPHEAAFPGLDEGAAEPGSRHVELSQRLAVQLDPTLADESPRRAGRTEPEVLDQQGRQVDRIAVRQWNLRHVVRRLVLTNDAGEVL